MKRWKCGRCHMSFEPQEPAHPMATDERLRCECGVAYVCNGGDKRRPITCWLIRRGVLPPGNIRKIA